MTPPSDDTVGETIWPGALRRHLGARYVETTQVALDADISETQAAMTLQMLAEMGNLQPWVAPRCPSCDHLWPCFLGEDDIPPKIQCPECKEVSSREDFSFYLVYEVLRDLDE